MHKKTRLAHSAGRDPVLVLISVDHQRLTNGLRHGEEHSARRPLEAVRDVPGNRRKPEIARIEGAIPSQPIHSPKLVLMIVHVSDRSEHCDPPIGRDGEIPAKDLSRPVLQPHRAGDVLLSWPLQPVAFEDRLPSVRPHAEEPGIILAPADAESARRRRL